MTSVQNVSWFAMLCQVYNNKILEMVHRIKFELTLSLHATEKEVTNFQMTSQLHSW